MSDPTTDFSSASFNPRRYVQLLTCGQATRATLHEQHQLVQQRSIKNAQDLKDNVYKNYHLYIDASNEISKFEADVQTLSLHLDEQGATFKDLRKLMSTGEAPGVEQVETHTKPLSSVDGLDLHSPLVANVNILHQGKLFLVDRRNYETRHNVHLFLLPEAYVVAKYQQFGSSNESKEHLTYETLHPLSGVTVEFLADTAACRHGFMVSSTSETYFVTCGTGGDCRAWKAAWRNALASFHGRAGDDKDLPLIETEAAAGPTQERLADVPGDLDVCIAQRAFKDAVQLAVKAKEELDGPIGASIPELKQSIEGRISFLTNTLCLELQRPAMRMQTIRNIVSLLLQLGESEMARRMYLTNRGKAIERALQKLKMEGSTELYMRKYSAKLFGTIRQTCKEFDYLFDDLAKSAFVSWVQEQLRMQADELEKQVFKAATGFSTTAECIENSYILCRQLADEGLDMEFYLWVLLEKHIKEAVDDAGQDWFEHVARLLDDEKWQPQEFSGKVKRKAFLEQLVACGVDSADNYCYVDGGGGLKTVLCEATSVMCTASHAFVTNAVRLINPKVSHAIESRVSQIFLIFMDKVVEVKDGRELITTNAEFIIELAGRAKTQIEGALRRPSPPLSSMLTSLDKKWAASSDNSTV